MIEKTIILVIALTVFSTAVVAGAHFIPSSADERAATQTSPTQTPNATNDTEDPETSTVEDVKSEMQNRNDERKPEEDTVNDDPDVGTDGETAATTPDETPADEAPSGGASVAASPGTEAVAATPVRNAAISNDDDDLDDLDDDYDDYDDDSDGDDEEDDYGDDLYDD